MGRIYVMKSTASCNKAMLINQASMPVCIDGRQEELLSIYVLNMACKIFTQKLSLKNFSKIIRECRIIAGDWKIL